MQNPHNFFSVPPNSSASGVYDSGASSRPPYMTFPSSMMASDNLYSMNPSMTDRSYQTSLASSDSSQVPLINRMSGMLAPPRVPGVDLHHSAPRNVWNPASGAPQRDTGTEVYRQFQLQRAPDGTPPVFQSPGQFSTTSNSGNGGRQFGEAGAPAQSAGVDMSMLLAQVMSVPLATAFLQGMMANTPATAATPPANSSMFPVMPPQNPMISMMQQMFQSIPQPATAAPIPVASPNQSAPHNSGVQAPMQPPSVGEPQAIQLPPMDANVAKTLLLQLAQQLQQAGQLPNDDTFQNFLRTVQSPGATMVTSTCGSTGLVKVEVKKEPIDSTSSVTHRTSGSMKNKLLKQTAKSEKPDKVVPKTEDVKESTDIKLSKSSVSRVSSSGVYIDVAESAKLANRSDDDNNSEFDVGGNLDSYNSSESSGEESLSLRSSVKKKKKSKSGNLSSSSSQKSCSKQSTVHQKKASSELKSLGKKKMSKTKAQMSYQDHSSVVLGDPVRSATDSEKHGNQIKKVNVVELTRSVRWNQNIRLRDCFVKLIRVCMKRDADGRVILPNKESSRVARLKQHKVSINVLSSGEDAMFGGANMPKLEPETEVITGESTNRAVLLEKSRDTVEMPKLSVPRPLSSETTNKVLIEKPTTSLSSLNVAIVSNINSSKTPQLRSMYMGLPKDNMEWLSLVGCVRNHPGVQQASKQYCQCAFCPAVGEAPRDVALHIRSEHFELTFALNKIRVSTGSVLYICCRHCDFVAVEPTIMWIHFEIHHSIPGILDSSGSRIQTGAASNEDPPLKSLSLDDPLAPSTSFVCFDCGIVVADKDTNGASSRLARHALCNHPDTQNYNGCFVKLLMLQHIEGDARGPVTYRQAIYDQIHERSRREVFVCMLCRYSAFCPYLALSHNLMTHQTKHLLYVCSDCNYQCFTDSDMLSHNAAQHRNGAVSSAFTCSATLVKQSEYGSGYVEYGPFDNRKSVLVLVRKQATAPEPLRGKKPADKPVMQLQTIVKPVEEKLPLIKQVKSKTVKSKAGKRSSKRTTSKVETENNEDDDVKTAVEVQSTTVSSSESRKSKSAVVNLPSSSTNEKSSDRASLVLGRRKASTNRNAKISKSVVTDGSCDASDSVGQNIVDSIPSDIMVQADQHITVPTCEDTDLVNVADTEKAIVTDADEIAYTLIKNRNETLEKQDKASTVTSETIPSSCSTTPDEMAVSYHKVNKCIFEESSIDGKSDVDDIVLDVVKRIKDAVENTVEPSCKNDNCCKVLNLDSTSLVVVDTVRASTETESLAESSLVNNQNKINIDHFGRKTITDGFSNEKPVESNEVLNCGAVPNISDEQCDSVKSTELANEPIPIIADSVKVSNRCDRSAFSAVQSMMEDTTQNMAEGAETDKLMSPTLN